MELSGSGREGSLKTLGGWEDAMFAKCIIAGTKVYMSQDIEAERNCEKGFERCTSKKLDRDC